MTCEGDSVIVLYREDRRDPENREELESIRPHFPVAEFRSQCGGGRSVICRYSCLPEYLELEKELRYLGSRMLNTYEMHRWIANFDYYHDLRNFTFESWGSLAETKYEGPFVIKGKTNSRKHQWSTHMYAATRRDALRVEGELFNDSLIGPQGIVFRKYEPLRTFEIGINGMRFANEFRFFYLGTTCLSHGYYWTTAEDPGFAECTPKMVSFADEVAKITAEHCRFFVLDIAEKEDGEMICVEVNDGQMSGLSMNKPDVLWSNMRKALPRVV